MPRRRGVKVRVFERGVPSGWCVERRAPPSKFDRRSFRTVFYTKEGRRATSRTGVRGITVGCPKGQWVPHVKVGGYKTSGKCKVGTRVQRILVRPGHYGCPKNRRKR